MKIFVIGGTGFLGNYLVPRLAASHHDIRVLTRQIEKKDSIEKMGAAWIIGDILKPDDFLPDIKKPELIIFIAMPPVKPGRITKKQFQHLRDITTKYFQNSISITKHFNCPIILTSGTSFNSDEEKIFTENDTIQRFGMAKIGENTDKEINQALATCSPPCIVMMPGQIYGPGGLFLTMHKWIKSGKYRIIGKGSNYIPRIYVEDLADAYVKAIEKMPLGEKFIIADDTPCTTNDFAQTISRELELPPVNHVPKFVVRLVAGKLPFQTITMNCKVSNEKVKKYLNWKPKYSYKDGIKKTIEILEEI